MERRRDCRPDAPPVPPLGSDWSASTSSKRISSRSSNAPVASLTGADASGVGEPWSAEGPSVLAVRQHWPVFRRSLRRRDISSRSCCRLCSSGRIAPLRLAVTSRPFSAAKRELMYPGARGAGRRCAGGFATGSLRGCRVQQFPRGFRKCGEGGSCAAALALRSS